MARSVALVLSGLLLLAAGCGSRETLQPPGPDAGGTGPGQDGGQPPAVAVVTAATASVFVESQGGGYRGPAPQGAACDPGHWTYTITLASHQVVWNRCDVTGDWQDPAAYVPDQGERSLADAEWAPVQAALDGLQLSTRAQCGADADSRDLTVTDASGPVTYGDDFYACNHLFMQYVTFDSLNVLQSALQKVQ